MFEFLGSFIFFKRFESLFEVICSIQSVSWAWIPMHAFGQGPLKQGRSGGRSNFIAGFVRPREYHFKNASTGEATSGIRGATPYGIWEPTRYQRVRRRDFPEKTCLRAQEFQCIGLCRLCMNAFPERWIIKLPRCLPTEKFPTSGGCPGNQHLTDTQRCQNRGPVRLLVSLLEFNQEEKHHEQAN